MEILWHSRDLGTILDVANGSTDMQISGYRYRTENKTPYKVSRINIQASRLSSTQEVEGSSPIPPTYEPQGAGGIEF